MNLMQPRLKRAHVSKVYENKGSGEAKRRKRQMAAGIIADGVCVKCRKVVVPHDRGVPICFECLQKTWNEADPQPLLTRESDSV